MAATNRKLSFLPDMSRHRPSGELLRKIQTKHSPTLFKLIIEKVKRCLIWIFIKKIDIKRQLAFFPTSVCGSNFVLSMVSDIYTFVENKLGFIEFTFLFRIAIFSNRNYIHVKNNFWECQKTTNNKTTIIRVVFYNYINIYMHNSESADFKFWYYRKHTKEKQITSYYHASLDNI